MAVREISLPGMLARFAGALVLVFATYNPSGHSYYHWLQNSLPDVDPVLAIAGVTLLIGWTMFLRATWRSLGLFGVILAAAFFGTLLWFVIDRGWLSPDNATIVSYVVLVLLSAVLAVGMTWSHIRRRLTGQFDVDDVEDD